jgi:hypothetical protein
MRSDEQLHLIGFHSKKFEVIEINYEIHDKELLAIINTFEEATCFERVKHIVIVYINHKNLEYFMNF